MTTGDPTYNQVAGAAPQDGVAAPADAGAEGQEQPQPQPSMFETLKSLAVRIIIFYFIMNFFKHGDYDFYEAREIKFGAEFKSADLNSDLVLSREELSSWLKQKGEEARKTVDQVDQVVEDIFAHFDKDKDGLLSYDETPLPYFKVADVNSDLFLSRDEQASFLKWQSEETLKEMEDLEKMMEGIFTGADKDRDGLISHYEFVEFYSRHDEL